MSAPQFELPEAGEVFNLAPEAGIDPDRIIAESQAAERAKRDADEFTRKMQRQFKDCPGFAGGELPCGEGRKGSVVIDPAKSIEAWDWLRRRFHTDRHTEITPQGIWFDVVPKSRRKGHVATVRRLFAKTEQFTLALD